MPIQAPQWTDYLNCPVCCREFGAPPRSPISLGCGHTLCRHCLKHLHRKQCPFDQTVVHVEPEELVVNTALLQLAGYTPPPQPYHPPSIQALPEHDRQAYDCIVKCMEHLAVYLKYCGNATNSMAGSRLSRPMQRKLVMLLQCAITDEEGRGRAARAARSLGERTVTELILQHQNPQQLSANLWAAVRARGCQFLGPAMQEEVLKLVLLALEDGSALSRKVLVMFVVQRLEPHFPQASKTSIGHVVQLLYRASCFKVSKRECDSSLMQLKEEFRTYESLRREHDAQIVQIATEAGLRIAPDQWSALLYGDTAHKSHMQSIIDKLQTPQSFAQSVQELFIALQRTGDPAQLIVMSLHLDRLANIDASPDAKSPSWQQLAEVMASLKEVVAALIHYLQQQATGRDSNHNQKHVVQDRCLEPNSQTSPQTAASTPTHTKYKVSMCRDAAARSFCPRGTACTFAHSEEELERYRVSQMNGNYVMVPVANHQGVPAMPAPGIQPLPVPGQPPYPPYIAHPGMENHNYHIPMVPTVNMELPENHNHIINNGHQAAGYAIPHHQNVVLMNNDLMIPGHGVDRAYYGHFPGPQEHRPGLQYMPEMGPPPAYTPRANNGPGVPHPVMYPPCNTQEHVAQDDIFNPATVIPAELLPDYRAPPSTYGTVPLDRRTDAVWAPSPGDQVFTFTEIMNSLPTVRPAQPPGRPHTSPVPPAMPEIVAGPSCAPEALALNHVADRRIVGADRVGRPDRSVSDRLIAAAEAFRLAGADDRELEAGLQALERQIDTEFKNAD